MRKFEIYRLPTLYIRKSGAKGCMNPVKDFIMLITSLVFIYITNKRTYYFQRKDFGFLITEM